MRTIAIGGIPSVDLRRTVNWLNALDGVAVTLEARTLALGYSVVERLPLDPWLLNPDMTPLVRDPLRANLAAAMRQVYQKMAGDKPLDFWGDAHAHYLDPLDKPGFQTFLFKCFPESCFIMLLEDPVLCMSRLIELKWAKSGWDAADVVARHAAFADRIAREHVDSYRFDISSPHLLRSEVIRLGRWLNVGRGAIEDLTRGLLAPTETPDPPPPPVGASAMIAERLDHWTRELAR